MLGPSTEFSLSRTAEQSINRTKRIEVMSEIDVSQTVEKTSWEGSSETRDSGGRDDVSVTWAKTARVGESGKVDLGLLPSKNVRHQDSIRQEAKR